MCKQGVVSSAMFGYLLCLSHFEQAVIGCVTKKPQQAGTQARACMVYITKVAVVAVTGCCLVVALYCSAVITCVAGYYILEMGPAGT